MLRATDSGSTWILTTGDTKYSPGSIAVTSVSVRDWQGITDDISFFLMVGSSNMEKQIVAGQKGVR